MKHQRTEWPARYRTFVIGFYSDDSAELIGKDSPNRYEADLYARLAREHLSSRGMVQFWVLQMKPPFLAFDEVVQRLVEYPCLRSGREWVDALIAVSGPFKK
jgi:hypothetical protein